LKKPRISFIHLEEFGSFIWTVIDGKQDIIAIGKLVKEKFGDKAEPLYERLAGYIKTLHTNGFISII
ncbi:MAG: PqqD family protein, partial [Clostridia bacterium]|nr:PqqD family protein [Clostridia bacterium]